MGIARSYLVSLPTADKPKGSAERLEAKIRTYGRELHRFRFDRGVLRIDPIVQLNRYRPFGRQLSRNSDKTLHVVAMHSPAAPLAGIGHIADGDVGAQPKVVAPRGGRTTFDIQLAYPTDRSAVIEPGLDCAPSRGDAVLFARLPVRPVPTARDMLYPVACCVHHDFVGRVDAGSGKSLPINLRQPHTGTNLELPAGAKRSRRVLAAVIGWRVARSWLSALIAIFSASVTAQQSYSPYVGQNYPTTVYWGDTHLHTSLSVDAYSFGNRLGPAEAYRFARGEPVTASNGMRVQLRRPLDFLVLADHDNYLGVMTGIEARDGVLLATDAGRRMLRHFEELSGKQPTDPKTLEILGMAVEFLFGKRPDIDEAFTRSVWNQVTAAADRQNYPGRFTAFIGYEWTSRGRAAGGNLHRVVIFRDGAEKANKVMPFSSSKNSQNPEALWSYMAEYESQIGGQVLAITHNGNLSNGEMFSMQNFAGQPLTRSYAESRSRWEPLYEVTQIKGDSEAHPFLSPTDEFADYEIWNSWGGKELPAGRIWNEAERILKEGEYARPALKRGLGLHGQLGINPFKFGMIGSTDAHTSLSAVDENNFWGKAPLTNPGPDRSTNKLNAWMPVSQLLEMHRKFNLPYPPDRAWQMTSSGYAAVWATENTREALFAAMKRKETYSTTGPRMTVRFFGGWDYSPEDALRPDLALIGYRKGVPMGGDLTNGPAGKTPHFLIRAVKDPDGAHLDRVQVVKGWLDAEGELHESIYNVALSDGRKEGQDGKAAPVRSTVDEKSATYTNTVGAPELATVWTDPDFDPKELAFYYVRVLEIPTPRWTAYDAAFFGNREIPAEVPMVTQERACTSPIWYTPQPK